MARPNYFRRHHRPIAVTLAATLALVGSATIRGPMGWVDGFFYDLSLAMQPARPGNGGEPVAVIAIDRGSLASHELSATPRVLFAPFWAKLIDGLVKGGVKAIGFDIIFSYSANRFPALDPQYDRGFYDVLALHHRQLVLARSAGLPVAAPVEAAVYDLTEDAGREEPAAIAFAELSPDSDGVQRRVAPNLSSRGGHLLPTISAALLSRADAPSMPDPLLLAPSAPLEAIPTYRLIDVLRCLDQRPATIAETFSGKVVLVGSTIPEEDRKRTPDRLMRPVRVAPVEGKGCTLARLGASHAEGGTTPGVFVHAGAVEAVMTGNLVRATPLARAGSRGGTDKPVRLTARISDSTVDCRPRRHCRGNRLLRACARFASARLVVPSRTSGGQRDRLDGARLSRSFPRRGAPPPARAARLQSLSGAEHRRPACRK